MFLQNAWYVAAWDDEVGREPLGRTILNQPIVLYRTAAGAPVALYDRCCHRMLPLSMGTVIGDDLRCNYHGLLYDSSGTCVRVPGQAEVPPGARVRSFPVVERWHWIWIWMGEPGLADESLIPNWTWCTDPQWKLTKGNDAAPLYIKCNYQLITENLMDVTHIIYVHESTIGTEAMFDYPDIKVERLDRAVRMSRWILDRPAAPFYQWAGRFDGNVDRWLVTQTEMPCHTVNDVGCAPVGTGARDGDRSKAIEFKVLNLPTPETERTTHYFYARVRRFAIDDREMDQAFRDKFDTVFREDRSVLEAQQRRIDGAPEAPSIDINADAAGLATRRMLRSMIEEEAAASASLRRSA